MPLPSFVVPALGAGASALTSRSAAKAQKEMARRQAQTIELQNQLFRRTTPTYEGLLQQLAQRAGVGMAPGLTQTGAGHFASSPMGSNFGTPEDQLRLQAAEEDANRYYRMQANALRHQFGQGGAGLGAALTRLGGQQAQGLSQFRRNLAIQAPLEQERRLQALQGALGFGLGQGAQAAAGYGQQANMYGQQAAAANQGLAGIIQNYQMQRMLQQYGQQPGGGGVGLGGVAGYRDTYTQPMTNGIPDELLYYLSQTR